MWRRIYLVLLLVRLYFALSPSYLHPDEHFQGPEVIAGKMALPSGVRRAFVNRYISRRSLLVSRPSNMGIYLTTPNPKRLPVVALLRPSHGDAPIDLGRPRP